MKIKFGPFEASRIKLGELYTDSINYIKTVYGNVGDYFTLASPLGQLLQITLQACRMILYYIEDSITELNILTASRPQSIKGLARLTGHNPSRSISARGTVELSYNGSSHDIKGNIAIIPNYTEIINNNNGLSYIIILNGNETRLSLNSLSDRINVSIIQGTLEYQTATGTGTPLQSYNFQQKKGKSIDNYFTNVYVNGEKWNNVESILDLSYNEKGVMIKTGQTGGLDIFFGNGYNGRIPNTGSIITIEYLITDGLLGNTSNSNNISNNWVFKGTGYNLSSETIDLNDIININVIDELMFGTIDEPLYLTRLLAPNTSRSYVLANATNYIYFLKKLNMFSIIDAFSGYNTFEDKYANTKLEEAEHDLTIAKNTYLDLVKQFGENSDKSKEKLEEIKKLNNSVDYWNTTVLNLKKDDNTVYLFLIPDIKNKLSSSENYYNVSDDIFKMSDNEKTVILDLIEQSGQRALTVDNIILTPKYVNFATNIYLVIWENYDINNILNDILIKTSDYFINNTRRDRIPVSDLTKIVENIDGVDSVTINFAADKNNKAVYGNDSYGLDEYGDIILSRYIADAEGNNIEIKDIYPLFRGGFTSQHDIYYNKGYDKTRVSGLNISIRGVTKKNFSSMYNAKIISGI
ncbi:MAG: hypothetical protein RSE41_02905 [Clostridia bacterium]